MSSYEKWVNENLINVPNLKDEIEIYLNYSYELYENMDASELSAIIWDFSRYSIFLKRAFNEQKAKYNWITSFLLKAAKPRCKNYESYDKDERFYSAISEDDVLSKYLKEQEDSKLKMDTIYDIERQIGYSVGILNKVLEYKNKIAFLKKERENEHKND